MAARVRRDSAAAALGRHITTFRLGGLWKPGPGLSLAPKGRGPSAGSAAAGGLQPGDAVS
jgi:hypothetical protein